MARGRFAPSPTGDLHLGSATTAVVSWLAARASGASFVMRVDDLDAPRVLPGMESRQLDDLRWLGLDWDEGPDVGGSHGPYRQSERLDRYEAALASLAARDLLYYCDCSRADIARIASAPHAGDEGPRYPGSCRAYGLATRPWRRPPALRVRMPIGRSVTIDDAIQGTYRQDVEATVGDFVVRRGDGTFAYHLACVVDDLAMGVTEIVRGADLLPSAPRQVILTEMLGGTPPTYAHVPLVVARDGSRLAKRAHGVSLRDHRNAGAAPGTIVTAIARLLDLAPSRVEHVSELRAQFGLDRIRRTATVPFTLAAAPT